jgi:hypothetical protein
VKTLLHRSSAASALPCWRARLRLDQETNDAIEMTLMDAAGGFFILNSKLEGNPRGLDLSLLAEAWARWKHEAAVTL